MSKFTDDITFTRGTGATRINAAGLIVGVDFSSTSVTIGTGAKTFTLTADANVDRDWPVGSAVRVVDQVSANTMEGTVTTYTPSTQALVLDITSVTGSGTFTNWRIGSLEVRRDADGVLREPMRSNLVFPSENLAGAGWTPSGATSTANQATSPNGSIRAALIAESATTEVHFLGGPSISIVSGTAYSGSVFLKKGNGSTAPDWIQLTYSGATHGVNQFANFNLSTGAIGVVSGGLASIVSVGNGYFLCHFSAVATTTASGALIIGFTNNTNSATRLPSYLGQTTSNFFGFGAQIEAGSTATSYIPTTTVAVTRNADTFTFTPAAIAKFRQGQGALIVEANASDAGTAQRAALRLTGPSGEIRFGKQGVATSGNFTKMAEGGGVQLLGNATQGVTNNGLEYGLFNGIRTNNNAAVGPFQMNAVAYNGTNEFGILTTTTENLSNSTLSNYGPKGLGSAQLNGAHHNGSRFLIATNDVGTVGISTDGLSYRRVNTPVIAQACNEVTSGMVGPTLRNVIVGNAGFIATSDDNGETWTARTSNTNQNLGAVAFGNGRFVATSVTGSAGAYSDDGITWIGVATNYNGNDAHYANGIWVKVSGGGQVQTSALGITWTNAANTNTTQSLNGVHYNASAGLWVAVGANGTIITATDPTGTWTLQTSGSVAGLAEVNYFNGLWIAVGVNAVLTSPNAITWTSRTLVISNVISGIAASPTRLIIVGALGGFASSEDGLTYTSRTNNNATLNGIAYGAGVYVSVGNAINGSGYIATIDDAGTVTRRVSGTTSNILALQYLRGRFIAGTQANANGILTSTDGAAWTVRSYGGSTFNIFDWADSGTLFVGVGSAARYVLSTDGVNFGVSLQIAAAGGQQLNTVAFANGVFIAGGNAGVLFTGVESGGAITWTARTSGVIFAIKSIMFSVRDQRWYAAGDNGTLLYSEDNGVTWASVNNAGFGAVSNTTLQVSKLLPVWKSGRNTMALSYKANEVIVGLNGVAVTDTANTIPSITGGVLGETFNGKIKSAKFQPNPLTAAEVVAITGVTK